MPGRVDWEGSCAEATGIARQGDRHPEPYPYGSLGPATRSAVEADRDRVACRPRRRWPATRLAMVVVGIAVPGDKARDGCRSGSRCPATRVSMIVVRDRHGERQGTRGMATRFACPGDESREVGRPDSRRPATRIDRCVAGRREVTRRSCREMSPTLAKERDNDRGAAGSNRRHMIEWMHVRSPRRVALARLGRRFKPDRSRGRRGLRARSRARERSPI